MREKARKLNEVESVGTFATFFFFPPPPILLELLSSPLVVDFHNTTWLLVPIHSSKKPK
jgi:hypothetical protein